MAGKANTSWWDFYQEQQPSLYVMNDRTEAVEENRSENAVASGVDWTKNGHAMSKNVGKAKNFLKFTLKEFCEEDQNWVQHQETKNKEHVQHQTVLYPSLEIVTGKWIRVEHQMATGEVWVILEQFPNKHNRFTGLRLNGLQWMQVSKQWETIMSYVHAAEMGMNWKIMAKNNKHYYEETQPSSDRGFEYCQEVRFQVCDDSVYVALKSSDPWNYGGCRVDIRKCVHVRQKHRGGSDKNAGGGGAGGGGGDQKERFVHLLQGITLVGGGFHYLVKYLVPQIDEAIEMYEAMFLSGRTYFQRRFNVFPDSLWNVEGGKGDVTMTRRIQTEGMGVDEPDA